MNEFDAITIIFALQMNAHTLCAARIDGNTLAQIVKRLQLYADRSYSVPVIHNYFFCIYMNIFEDTPNMKVK